eukprot:798217-Prymnesium_polylepis.1
MVAVEVVRRVLAVAGGVGARALVETAQQRRHRRRSTEKAFGDERDDGVRPARASYRATMRAAAFQRAAAVAGPHDAA